MNEMLLATVRFLNNDTKRVMTSRQLYKYLLRQCERLPSDACKHYKFSIKQSYKQHISESDPERIKEIIAKSIENAKWIVNKYNQK
ncbi:unnamed protein product [Parnassius apollo]|uniref:LYR motif-containing protein 9 n=1 Tax=Parnassius apollo TaxID=110799 RepID=A0A8S3WY82_PARAO|nr:unnamed protein product [Parnassius apollo]